MTPPVQPQAQGFDYEGARRAGLSPAMIEDYLRRHPQGPPRPVQVQIGEQGGQPIAAPSLPNTAQHPDNAPTAASVPQGYAGDFNRGLVRQTAQGLTMGFADELEAGARAPFSDRSYKDIRNDIRTQNEDFSGENPLLSLGANIIPGMVTGSAVGAGLRAVGMGGRALPAAAGIGAKMGAAAKAGAGYGAAAGAGSAPELRDVPLNVLEGGVAGGALGAGATVGGEMMGGARNLIAGTKSAEAGATGPIRSMIQSQGPDQAAAQRVMRILREAGFKNLDEVAAASAGAAPEAAVAELSANGKTPGIKGLRVARNMGRERDAIDQSLTERANEEPANWSRTLAKTTGVAEPRDAQAVADEAYAAIKPKIQSLNAKAANYPDVDSPEVAKVVGELHDMGETGVIQRAGKLAIGRNTLQGDGTPTTKISVRNLQFLRRSIDRRMEELRAMNPPDKDMLDILGERRQVVDGVLKKAGGPEQVESDKLWENASSLGESFKAGGKVEQIGTAEGVDAAKSAARDPEAFRQGVASKLQERAAGVSDGEGGQVRNPTQGALGSRTRRARTSAGFMGPDKFQEARDDAGQIVKRLDTRRMVSSNSTTAANLEEMADEFMASPAALAKLVMQPASALKLVGGAAMNRAKGINTAQATEMGKLLGGGLPGQHSRDDVIRMLRDAEPAAVLKILKDVGRRGGAAGATVRMGTEKGAR